MQNAVELLQAGLEHHLGGRFAEAEALYRQAIELDPHLAHAWNLLGALTVQKGSPAIAASMLGRAVELNGGEPSYRLNFGAVLFQLGRLDEAAAQYAEAVRLAPNAPEPLVSLGNVRLRQNQPTEALRRYDHALALAPRNGAALLHSAACLGQLGRKREAIARLETLLTDEPAQATALGRLVFLLSEVGEAAAAFGWCQKACEAAPDQAALVNCFGVALALAGRPLEAAAHYRRALQLAPNSADVWSNLGAALTEAGRAIEALQALEQAVRVEPGNAPAHYNLGDALRSVGRNHEAIASYRQAIRLDPQDAKSHNNLGAALQEIGRDTEAMEAYRRATELNPRSVEALNNYGNALRTVGRPHDAIRPLEQAITLDPRFAEAHNNLGLVLLELGKYGAALAHFERAETLRPNYFDALVNLGDMWRDLSDRQRAYVYYDRALAIKPSDGLRIKKALALPIIVFSSEHIDAERARLSAAIDELTRQPLSVAKPITEVGTTSFYLAYHGRDDRPSAESLARLFIKAIPDLDFTPSGDCPRPMLPGPRRRRYRIGFISSLFRDHTIGHLNAGMIRHLSRERFEVVLCVFSPPRDWLAEQIYASADRVVHLPGHLARARELLLAEQLDALYYTDIGMEPSTYFLAFSRLAAVQCVSWGHPVTTGIPAIDYFISACDLEPAGADEHYTERLARLAQLPTFYTPSQRQGTPLPRARFGIGDDANFYACVQSLFKLQPDFDQLLAGILDADPKAEIALVESATPPWNDLIRRRLQTHIPEHFERIRFVPRLTSSEFIELTAAADVLLDTTHFSGGRTTLDALALGTPVVTLPGPWMRSRVSYACYQKMQMMDCVARDPADYVRIAVRLGTDRAWRESVRARIAASAGVLFENRAFLCELEEFLVRAIESTDAR